VTSSERRTTSRLVAQSHSIGLGLCVSGLAYRHKMHTGRGTSSCVIVR